MKEYIEREALLEAIDTERSRLLVLDMVGAEHIVVHNARRLIEEIPAADVVERSSFEAVGQKYAKIQDKLIRGELVERKRGEWVEYIDPLPWCEDDVDVYWQCSVCDMPNFCQPNFCPNCGADMRGDDHA